MSVKTRKRTLDIRRLTFDLRKRTLDIGHWTLDLRLPICERVFCRQAVNGLKSCAEFRFPQPWRTVAIMERRAPASQLCSICLAASKRQITAASGGRVCIDRTPARAALARFRNRTVWVLFFSFTICCRISPRPKMSACLCMIAQERARGTSMRAEACLRQLVLIERASHRRGASFRWRAAASGSLPGPDHPTCSGSGRRATGNLELQSVTQIARSLVSYARDNTGHRHDCDA